MKSKHLLGYLTAASVLAACGGESESKAPDINIDVEVIEVVGPDQPEDDIVNTALPITENFDTVADAATFFSSQYMTLASEAESDDIDNFYHSTAGVFMADGTLDPDPNNWITGDDDPHMRLGNARFTIGQIVSVHVPETAEDPRKNTTPGDLKDATTSWGELDLTGTYTVSFCTVAASTGGTFFIYIDNNTTSSGSSVHGSASKYVEVPVNSLVEGERASFDIDVGTPNSFLQFRVDSGGWMVFDDLVIENAANPAGDQPACAGKTTNYTQSPDGDDAVPAPPQGVPFAGLPAVGESFDVDFSVGIDNFFGGENAVDGEFVSMSDNAEDPFYKVTSGGSRITIDNGKLSMNNARFTIGDSGAGTSDTAQPEGDINLSGDYRITLVISEFSDVDAAEPGSFVVYVDNNTSSSGSSTHGGDSKVHTLQVADVDALPYTLVLEPGIGTENSFIQLRADSKVANITIDSVSIEALEAPVETIAWGVFNGDAIPTATGAVTDATGNATEFTDNDSNAATTWSADSGVASFVSTDADTKSTVILPDVVGEVFPKTFTLVTRMQNTDLNNRGIEIEARFGGDLEGNAGRIKFLLRESKIQLEKFDDTNTAEYSMDTSTDFHIYHIAVTLTDVRTATANVWVDGVAVAEMTDLSTTTLRGTSANSNQLSIGDGSTGNLFNADVDYVVWTADGAYTPAELAGKLPENIGVITGYEAAE